MQTPSVILKSSLLSKIVCSGTKSSRFRAVGCSCRSPFILLQSRTPLLARTASTLHSSPQNIEFRKYQYKSLPGSRWIRLLQIIRPSESESIEDPEAPLSCRLVDVRLDDKPKYDALSYSWDGQVPDQVLLVQNHPDKEPRELLVTKNCADALRAFRKREAVDNIWIDAVSINQEDLQERNSQVSMMGDIYAGAFPVRVWLGPETETSDGAVRALLKLWGTQESSPDSSWVNNDLRQAIVNFANNPYWQRMWTLQEISVAKLVVVHIGDERLHYFTLAQGAQRTGDDIDFLRMGTHFFMSSRTKHETGDNSLAHLLTALLYAQSKNASEPRDNIYALRSVLPELFGDVVVDYAKSIQEVFLEGTKAVIERTKSLEVLRFRHITELSAGMPSWVVDWSNTSTITPGMLEAYLPASFPAISQKIRFSAYDQTLNVRGRILDTIHHVDWPLSRKFDYELRRREAGAARYFSSFDAVMDIVTIRRWIEIAIKVLQRHLPIEQILDRVSQVLDPDFRSKLAFADWFKAMAADVPGSGFTAQALDASWQSKMTPELEDDVRQSLFRLCKGPLIELETYNKVRMNIFLDATGDKNVMQQHFSIIGRLFGQKFFITTHGLMGTCTEQSRKSDQVVALEGASFLVNLRRDGEKNSLVGPIQIPILREDLPQLLEDETLLEEIEIS